MYDKSNRRCGPEDVLAFLFRPHSQDAAPARRTSLRDGARFIRPAMAMWRCRRWRHRHVVAAIGARAQPLAFLPLVFVLHSVGVEPLCASGLLARCFFHSATQGLASTPPLSPGRSRRRVRPWHAKAGMLRSDQLALQGRGGQLAHASAETAVIPSLRLPPLRALARAKRAVVGVHVRFTTVASAGKCVGVAGAACKPRSKVRRRHVSAGDKGCDRGAIIRSHNMAR